jgi:hypothetical protein
MGTNDSLLLFQIGITLQPVALHRNVYASVVEDMILKVSACWQQKTKQWPWLAALKGQPGRMVGSQAVLSRGQGQTEKRDDRFLISHLGFRFSDFSVN